MLSELAGTQQRRRSGAGQRQDVLSSAAAVVPEQLTCTEQGAVPGEGQLCQAVPKLPPTRTAHNQPQQPATLPGPGAHLSRRVADRKFRCDSIRSVWHGGSGWPRDQPQSASCEGTQRHGDPDREQGEGGKTPCPDLSRPLGLTEHGTAGSGGLISQMTPQGHNQTNPKVEHPTRQTTVQSHHAGTRGQRAGGWES